MSLAVDIVNCVTSKYALIVSVLVYLAYKWLVKNNNFFEDRGIKGSPPTIFFGNVRKMITLSATLHDVIQELYNSFPKEKIFGFFELRKPVLMVWDPEIIKRVAVQDFDHFVDHRPVLDEVGDALFGRGLFFLTGSKWRDMRATLSPAFTGSKMRNMFQLIIDCADRTRDHLLDQSRTERPLVLEMKDLFVRFGTDVIATSAFGIEVNSFKDPKNEFYEMGREVSNFGGIRFIIFTGFSNFPKLMKLFKFSFLTEDERKFFRRLVIDSMKYRTQHNVHRPDMINLMMEARKGKLIHEKEEAKSDGFSVVEESDVGKTIHKRGNR